MGYRPRTKRGYNMFEVASCLQKAIRRAETDLAGYMAIELFESGFAKYCWKRLLTISAEDCAGVITQEIKSLFDSWLVLTDNGEKQKSRIFISKAVIVLCQSRKSRDADHLTNYIYDRAMVDAQRLEAAIEEARSQPENVALPRIHLRCPYERWPTAGPLQRAVLPRRAHCAAPEGAGRIRLGARRAVPAAAPQTLILCSLQMVKDGARQIRWQRI